MTAIDIARTLADRQETADAQRAYTLVLQQADGSDPVRQADPALELEAAAYLFHSGGDYKVAYTTFHSLYNRGLYQSELFDLMVSAFYAPNVEEQEKRYQKNCKLLGKYPYLFCKDFPAFDDLPVKFFPFDDNGFLPFDTQENRFGNYVNYNDTIIDRNFFKDLENPILADDVYSQYQLEYLNDNVRRSDWAARENHIYLHYTDWAVFCSHLQVLDFKALLKDEKLVFLMEDEGALYPIDFKARFGLDYSQYTVKPFSVTEVKRLIWHTQLAAHNGGDFFNEIFYGHPNLLAYESVIFSAIEEEARNIKQIVADARQIARGQPVTIETSSAYTPQVVRQLMLLEKPTDKDFLVSLFLGRKECSQCLDPNSRIAPALLFQPHFKNMSYHLSADQNNSAVLDSEQYQQLRQSPLLRGFPYIKTFTPMRRITTSYTATVKFMGEQLDQTDASMGDAIAERVLNRSFMYDWQDRLYHDSVLVRFEDGKLNPKATFTALAAFLDIPYTHSMTYCSSGKGMNPESLEGNAVGFDPAKVYEKYSDYANGTERAFLEYFMRDAYEYYGYGFETYDGTPVDQAKAEEMVAGFTTLDGWISKGWEKTATSILRGNRLWEDATEEGIAQAVDNMIAQHFAHLTENRQHIIQILLRNLRFVNRAGQPLRMMTPLKLDPTLLEAPLYH